MNSFWPPPYVVLIDFFNAIASASFKSLKRKNQQKYFQAVLRQIEFHRTIANIQRVAYNNSVKVPNEFYDEGITIEMDFKQKIVYGKKLSVILIK